MATVKKTVAKKAAPAKKAAAPRAAKAVAAKASAAEAAPKKVVVAGAMEGTVYSATGSKVETLSLPAEIFGVKWNPDLVHQVVVGMQANARPTVANTKFRGEVSGGGKKPWKQKGTGRARHGSTRSPIWKGGGVTHGPRAERDYSVKINRKMRVAALMSVISKKFKDGEVLFVEKLSYTAPKTKDAKALLIALSKAGNAADLSTKRKNAAVLAFSTKDTIAEKSFRNMGNIMTEEVRNLNPVDLLNRRYLIIENPAAAFATLSARLAKKS